MSQENVEKSLAVRWVVAIATLSMLLAATSAHAAFPGRNGRIAFATLRDRPIGPAIYTMNPNGSDQHRLAHGTTPRYSPDGKKIVYAAHRDGDWEIFMMRANGSHKRQITDNSVEDIEPSYSPNGKRIVFSRKLPDSYEVFKMRGDGTHERQLTHDSNRRGSFAATFSSDGTRIIYAEPSFNTYRAFSLFHMRTDGSVQRRFAIGNHPDASPYGHRVVADGVGTHSNRDIWKVGLKGGHYVLLTRDQMTEDEDPAFSPSGRRVVWSQDGSLFKMRSNGTRVRRLTCPPQSSCSGSRKAIAYGDFAPDWQPKPR
jgi:Tol biopolymer transport system component